MNDKVMTIVFFIYMFVVIYASKKAQKEAYKEGYRDGLESKAKVAKCPICGEHWTYYGGYVPEVYGNDRTNNDHHPS